ncbi:MAG: prepilin-type N-terminal cleavage/methylation domain-containing protein [Alphaproteobacteria bacterium]|jgi:prepilin-type N-terminal cleavage/methylation domain-containing protein|nr:prepilin-type N-terminal cleavage/methylation domain-containing protein [Alphaproteobacteria bacterium]
MTKKLKKDIPGFSLIEIALVLIVIGILAGAIFKGQDVLEAAKIRAVLNDIDRIRTASSLYHDTFGQWPGNDSNAKARFGPGVTNGQGNGLISTEEAPQFWVHLAKADHLSEDTAPASKLGGHFTVEGDLALKKNFLILSGPEGSGILTPKQASALKAKAGESDPSTGQIRIIEGAGAAPGSCVSGGTFHLATKSPTCIVRVELH